MIAAGFVLAAATGALIRWQVSKRMEAPLGTLLVNVVGSAALGFLHESDADLRVVLGVAGIGALTTFSTLAIEALEGSPRRAGGYVAATLICGTAAAWAGLRLA